MNPNDQRSASAARTASIDPELLKIVEARHCDPFQILGRHRVGSKEIFRAFLPFAEAVEIVPDGIPMARIAATDLFELTQPYGAIEDFYRFCWTDDTGKEHIVHDPYSFEPQLPDFDIHLFGEGRHWHIYRLLGAHPHEVAGIHGFLFATWAPNAQRVSVVGDFNRWDGRCHPMRLRGSGVWELFIPDLKAGDLYKFEIKNRQTGSVFVKSDPYGQHFEVRPKTASILRQELAPQWSDEHWISARKENRWLHHPISIYEVHLGSWARDENGDFLNYRELAEQLVAYVKHTGFTHVELLPVTEHPLDASWGYQTTGYFAPTSRHGSPEDFRALVDLLHRHGIGVILDWVPAHFPKDAHALARFDGTSLYEHEDPRLGEHRDWGTYIYNYSRHEVKNFLMASALFWLEEFHIDGLRVDAVASMLYLDYSREPHDWIPNIHGTNENLEAIEFLRELNTVIRNQHPGCMVIAEESTAWPQVTRPTWTGGLGFSMKWNMGWMHDTLSYMGMDPIYRRHHHNQLTFGLLYTFTENFVLPFSHDEVVHGKGSMIAKMPGDEWQRFANLRLLYTLMFTYPGKKLLFMGNEFAQNAEWNHHAPLDWGLLDDPLHNGIKTLVSDLNRLYGRSSALHHFDFEPHGFEWIDCHDVSQSVLSYIRKSDGDSKIVVLNFTPVPRENYRIGVPAAGNYHEIFNSDSAYYGGSNIGNEWVASEAMPWMDRNHSLSLTLPPLAAIILTLEK